MPNHPENLLFASKHWKVAPETIVGDFQSHRFACSFDIIFFLGLLYHVENVFGTFRRLRELLKHNGTVYLESQMSLISLPLPLYENASDIYPTIAEQGKDYLNGTGASNFLFPNEAAIQNLAYSFNFACEPLAGIYSRDYPNRGVFRLTKLSELPRKAISSSTRDSES